MSGRLELHAEWQPGATLRQGIAGQSRNHETLVFGVERPGLARTCSLCDFIACVAKSSNELECLKSCFVYRFDRATRTQWGR